MIMNFENLEQMRYENTQKVMGAMAEIACDKKAEPEHRLKAAKIVDGMSDTLIKAYALMSAVEDQGKAAGSMAKSINKLTDRLSDEDKREN